MSQVRLACGLPFFQTQEKQTNSSLGIRVALVAFGILTIVGGALLLRQVHGIGQWGITTGKILIPAGATLAAAAISLRCVGPKSTPDISDAKSNSAVITGSIAILNNTTAGALGRNLTHLPYNTKDAIKRIDGKDWTAHPEEMLIHCRLFNLGEKKEHLDIWLPLCLFVENDDYNKIKKDGDLVEFYYENTKYKLTINQTDSPTQLKQSFQKIVKLCNQAYIDKKGISILAKSNGESFFSPIELADGKNMRSDFVKDKEANDFLNQVKQSAIPPFVKYPNLVVIPLVRHKIEGVRILFAEKTFAIYIPYYDLNFTKNKPELVINPDKPVYLLVEDIPSNYTKEEFEKAVQLKSENGALLISWK